MTKLAVDQINAILILINEIIPLGNYSKTDNVISVHDLEKLKGRVWELA